MTQVDHRAKRASRTLGFSLGLALALAVPSWIAPEGTRFWSTLLAVALVSGLCHRFMNSPGAVPVLMYHSVSDDPSWLPNPERLSISVAAFERQLDLLARRRQNIISLDELVEARRNRTPLPARSLVLTFDDGYLDNWVAARSLLSPRNLPATFFVSTDFIEPGVKTRATLADTAAAPGDETIRWDGYMNAAEVRELALDDLMTVGSHGTDHGRVVTGPAVVDTLSAANWKRLAWVQWASMPGSKFDWYRETEPSVVPLSTPVRENGPALAYRRWEDTRQESSEEFEERVVGALRTSRDTLQDLTGQPVDFFCWPENAVPPEGIRLSRKAGYRASVAGLTGENRESEDWQLLSRVHVGDRVLGWRCDWIDDLAFLARLRVHQGNYYWYLILAPLHLAARLLRSWSPGLFARSAAA